MAVVENATPTTSSTDSQAPPPPPPDEQKPAKKGYGWRFWAIFTGLCIGGLLNSRELYVWAINGYFLSQTAVQPLYGQVANIFARRWPAILSVALFALGSGLGGGASSTGMLIAARVIQGLGGGGINVMTEIIVADLVPLRERQQVMGIIFTAFAVGTFVGPVVGGAIVNHTSWRWVFYINLPFSTVTAKLKRVDFAGNAILITSVISILPALTWAGTTHPWEPWRTIVPLLLGLAGMVAFLVY
ncbi:hypothetical protein AARAC_003581 [Aspergillus arachidicola]|uniref:Major facilitator superfamily (MFS) profile domain-containing protein n=1 Tax=Aspergillus arachidicola TaxID=656916 RepID=A0A2G7FFF2_9EURO|nr:hypothetical protein AARAC_003581 [Aspergillus arachidicola]